nr:MAG TPA: Splicing factor 3B subunit 10 (SF3b10) [Bacteriophage sp.]
MHSLLSESFERMAQPCGLQTMLNLQNIISTTFITSL